jgi:glycosyltransferase involved in cell wall biosynthesis
MHDRGRPARVALLTHGLHIGGGVPSVARWLTTSLRDTGKFDVDVFDLATSMSDENSRRVARPSTWTRPSLRSPCSLDECNGHFGANAVEVEFMRYRPRRELNRTLAGYDLVQVVCGTPAWAAAVRVKGVPLVVQAATTVAWERNATRSSARPAVRRWRNAMTTCTGIVEGQAVRSADAVMVENREMAEHVRKLRSPRVHIAPPGVDTTFFRPNPAGHQADGYLLSMCRLHDPRKGLDRMLRAYRVMLGRRPDLPQLVMAGRGPLSPPVRALIGQLGLADRVKVLPDVPRDALVGLYQGASVFLQTSLEEGLGISVLEAMSCGLPVVATKTAGSSETVVDGVTGVMVNQSDEDTLPRRFADGISNALSPAGAILGTAGRRRTVERFSTTAALAKYIHVYQSLLADSNSHA